MAGARLKCGRAPMRSVTRIVTYLVCVVIHVSGSPNPAVETADQVRCLSFAEAEARGLKITEMREEFTVAVEVFPDAKAELAEAWSDLQYTLRDRLQEKGRREFGGRSMFTIVLFEPDGHMAWIFHRGLDEEEASMFCAVVEDLAREYRFPLHADARFSQCGTTHFKQKEE